MTDTATARCNEKCWTPTPCPDHGNAMGPRGRSIGEGAYECCDNRMEPAVNPRHLWDIHDDTRIYVDPDGWDAHVSGCGTCWEASR